MSSMAISKAADMQARGMVSPALEWGLAIRRR
jgi:hypothetical protein